jgi:hypothetical protein
VPRVSSCPDPASVERVLNRVGSITALAGYYGVTFTTARRWIHRCGLTDSLRTEEHLGRLRKLESDAPTVARRARIDGDLERTLADVGDRKLLARAIVDEFNMRYVHKRCYSWERYVLRLTLVMYDFPPVEEIAHLVNVPWRMGFRKAKSGVNVPIWLVHIEGYRAFRVLQLTKPFLTGQKAFQAEIALRAGPITTSRVHLGKEIYKREMLASFGVDLPMFGGKGAGTRGFTRAFAPH